MSAESKRQDPRQWQEEATLANPPAVPKSPPTQLRLGTNHDLAVPAGHSDYCRSF